MLPTSCTGGLLGDVSAPTGVVDSASKIDSAKISHSAAVFDAFFCLVGMLKAVVIGVRRDLKRISKARRIRGGFFAVVRRAPARATGSFTPTKMPGYRGHWEGDLRRLRR